MGGMKLRPAYFLAALSFLPLAAFTQTTAAKATRSNTSFIDEQGTAHVTRVVPVPKTISPEAQKALARPQSDVAVKHSTEEDRAMVDAWQSKAGAAARQVYPATVTEGKIAGIPVRIITPPVIGRGKQDHVLLNFHGGGFLVDSGSLTETIPIANLTQTKVISVLYRLAPEHPFPASVEDTIAVYRELLKTYKPSHIAIYGTSAGAILTAETAVRIKQLKLPMPAALGIFSGMGDFSKPDDSSAIYGLNGFSGPLEGPPPSGAPLLPEYVAKTDPKDPVLSPVFADLHGMPPTLFITSTRDLLLSGTSILHRAFLHAGADAQLIVFEALPHAFWNDISLPESREAFQFMATFLDGHLAKK
jgi:monoterpene epsilon-lactone hydrolase